MALKQLIRTDNGIEFELSGENVSITDANEPSISITLNIKDLAQATNMLKEQFKAKNAKTEGAE